MFTSTPNLYEHLNTMAFKANGAACEVSQQGNKVVVYIYNLAKLEAGDDTAQCRMTFVPHKTGGWTMWRERPRYTTATEQFKTLLSCSTHIAYIGHLICK